MHIRQIFRFVLSAVLAGIGGGCVAGGSSAEREGAGPADPRFLPESYPNLLDIRKGAPQDPAGYFMSDLGCWHAYGFNSDQDLPSYGGFRGPYVMAGKDNRWVASCLERLQLFDAAGAAIPYATPESFYYPGRLCQKLSAGPLNVELEMIALSGRTTMISYFIRNAGAPPVVFTPAWTGTLAEAQDTLSGDGHTVRLRIGPQRRPALLRFPETVEVCVASETARVYQARSSSPVLLNPGATVAFHTFTTYAPAGSPEDVSAENLRFRASRADAYRAANLRRWREQLKSLLQRNTPCLADPRFRNWAVKAMMTLTTNWRSSAGDLRHDGLYPATGRFNGFWAWDSWEHAVGVSLFNPELAKDQIRAMFDYQTPEGMIVDVIRLEKKDNNGACSKPPLAGWAVYMVYQRTRDLDFLRELYPRLKRYHQWRYQYRDHNRNGLCEYGGVEPRVLFGQWESGMDVAIKFQGVRMIKNTDGAYSFDQESVELNSYLYAEKLYLAALADVLNLPEDAGGFRREALRLRQMIRQKMFDESTGYFYDIKSESGEFVRVIDVSGWIPLFTGVASPDQAARVRRVMLDPDLFGTFFPFSSLNHRHPQYHPEKGYFRGQTWMNYTYFGIRGFKNYGFRSDADRFTRLLPDRLEGIADPGFPIRENYSSATGAGLCASHFGWSSVFSLLLLSEDADDFPFLPGNTP